MMLVMSDSERINIEHNFHVYHILKKILKGTLAPLDLPLKYATM